MQCDISVKVNFHHWGQFQLSSYIKDLATSLLLWCLDTWDFPRHNTVWLPLKLRRYTYHPVHACFCTTRFVSNIRAQNTAAAPAETDWWTPSSDIHPHLKYIKKIIDFTLVKEILITSADSNADIKTDNLTRQSSIETFNWNKLDI